MRSIIIVSFFLLSTNLLRSDPEYYTRKKTWQDTLQASREALTDYLKKHGKSVTPDIFKCGSWYKIGPFTGEDSFEKAFAPEKEIDLKKHYGMLNWLKIRATDGNINSMKCPGNAVMYLYRTIKASKTASIMSYFGSDDGIAVWFNGKKLISNKILRGVSANQEQVKLHLRKGKNHLLIKIWNGRGNCGWYFSLSITPGAGTDPVTNMRNELWTFLERDFKSTELEQQMAWEKADKIWQRDWEKGDIAELGRRYVGPVKDTVFSLGQQAEQLAGSIKSIEELNKLRDLYYRAKRTQKTLGQANNINLAALRRGIKDLTRTYPEKYPKKYLERLKKFENIFASGDEKKIADTAEKLVVFSREAMLANPLLDFDKLLVLRRYFGNRARKVIGGSLGMPSLNSHTDDDIPHRGWNNEISVISNLRGNPPTLQTLYKPETDYILRDIDLDFDGDKIMFSSISPEDRWALFQINSDGSGFKQLSPKHITDIDFFDSCYLPNRKIVTCSTASYQGLPCENGGKPMVSLYLLNPENQNLRQLTFEQDSDWHPSVLNNGRVLYLRWEYSDTPHYYSRYLFDMNPDGTNQIEFYGSGSYFPTAFKHARQIPKSEEVVGIAGGHHSISESGRLLIIDNRYSRKYPFRYYPETKEFGPPGSYVDLHPEVLPKENTGFVQEIPGYGKEVVGNVLDGQSNPLFSEGKPHFLYPYPLSEKYFLVSMKRNSNALWGIYLVDIFDNMTLIMEEKDAALLEVIPFRRTKRPPVIADRIDLSKKTASVLITDIYKGGGLKGIPRGKVKKIRLFAYHFAYNKTGGFQSVGIESSWDIKRILGTVPIEKDGSAHFIIPANTPISLQPLDKDGAALQIMRSWFVGMPGEIVSCVGCHEQQSDITPVIQTIASIKKAAEISPWYGKARPFGFETEIQPLLNKYCVGCHCNNPPESIKKLLKGKRIPDFVKYSSGLNWSSSYKELQPYVRRPGPESDLEPFHAMEYHASTSDLVQLLRKGHYNLKLDQESWERFYSWIDLNAPYRGAWAPRKWRNYDQIKRRIELSTLYANVSINPEAEFRSILEKNKSMKKIKPVIPKQKPEVKETVSHFMFKVYGKMEKATRNIDIGNGHVIKFVFIPAGKFVMGSETGFPDERPRSVVQINKPFWMAITEITNGEFAQYDPMHDTRYIDEHGKDHAAPGFIANHRDQPVARVSWQESVGFCKWLSKKSGQKVTLPTEAQWEWASRAGTGTQFFYGNTDTDFSKYANLADRSLHFTKSGFPGGSHLRNANPYNNMLNYPLRDNRFNDHSLVSNYVGQYKANPWGIKDIIGNVNEWTRSSYEPYPYNGDDGRNNEDLTKKKVARGGSWYDRPVTAGASIRFPYESYQKVHDVGFRIIIED